MQINYRVTTSVACVSACKVRGRKDGATECLICKRYIFYLLLVHFMQVLLVTS